MTKAKTTVTTRRALLQGATAVAILAPAATIGAAAIASMPDPLALSPRFLDLVGEIDRLMAECLRLRSTIADDFDYERASDPLDRRRYEIEEEIAKTAPATVGDVVAKLRIMAHPVTGIDMSVSGSEGLSVRQSLAWLEQAAAALVVARTGTAPADPLIALDAERRRWRDLCNKAGNDDDINRFGDATSMVAQTMLGIPAISTAGALAKLHAADPVYLTNGKPDCLCDALAVSAMDDLDRLARGTP